MIIPVFDMRENLCVTGKSGIRESYKRLNSIYGYEPLMIAENLREKGFKYLYIADLDKIEDTGNNDDIISQINEVIPVLLDNGISTIQDAMENRKIASYSILATETMTSILEAENIIGEVGNENIIVSFDIKNNELLIENDEIDLDDIISLINNCNIKHVIILNLSSVGTKKIDDTDMQERIIRQTPNCRHILAGGITNQAIDRYSSEGIEDFLVGTILHEGSLDEKYI